MEALNIHLQESSGWVLRLTLQASVLIFLILSVQLLLRDRLGARACHALWLILLIRMVVPWMPQSRVSLFNLMPHWQPVMQQYTPAQVSDISVESRTIKTGMEQPAAATTTTTIQKQAKPIAQASEAIEKRTGTSKSVLLKAVAILPLVWLTGVLALGIYVGVNSIAFLRIVRRERPLTDQKVLELLEDCKAEIGVRTVLAVVATDKVKNASLFGFIRPRLLLPKTMVEAISQKELRYVFLHELGHLKRHDIYLGWLMCILQVMHWFNPLVWLAFYRVRADRELACDAFVLARTQADESKNYGQTVVSLLERFSQPRRLPAMAGILETKSELKRRITMIAHSNKNAYRLSPLAVVLIIIVGCVSLPDAKREKSSDGPSSTAQPVANAAPAGRPTTDKNSSTDDSLKPKPSPEMTLRLVKKGVLRISPALPRLTVGTSAISKTGIMRLLFSATSSPAKSGVLPTRILMWSSGAL